MKVTTLGIDLAKNVFSVHGVDAHGKTVMHRELRRRQLLAFMRQLEPCLVGMEACGSAHYWAREIAQLGHQVRLMSPQFVRPYVKSNKNDARDAEAICEAVGRPSMRFVAIKSQAQQDMMALHRVRSLLIRERTALMNEMRGLLAECGVIAVHPNFPPVISRVRPVISPLLGRVVCSFGFIFITVFPAALHLLRAAEKLSGFGSEAGAPCAAPASSAGQAVRATAELP